MKEVVKHIEFGVVKKPLSNYTAQIVLELICDCIKERRILDDYVLQEWWLEKMIKPRRRIKQTEYLGMKNGNADWKYENEYDYFRRKIKEYNGLMPGYYWSEAKQAFKYHIGNLVVNGYLIVLPVIKISEKCTVELPNVQESDTTEAK